MPPVRVRCWPRPGGQCARQSGPWSGDREACRTSCRKRKWYGSSPCVNCNFQVTLTQAYCMPCSVIRGRVFYCHIRKPTAHAFARRSPQRRVEMEFRLLAGADLPMVAGAARWQRLSGAPRINPHLRSTPCGSDFSRDALPLNSKASRLKSLPQGGIMQPRSNVFSRTGCAPTQLSGNGFPQSPAGSISIGASVASSSRARACNTHQESSHWPPRGTDHASCDSSAWVPCSYCCRSRAASSARS